MLPISWLSSPYDGGAIIVNPWHLLWIVPLSVFLGMFVASLLGAGDDYDLEDDEKSESGLLTED